MSGDPQEWGQNSVEFAIANKNNSEYTVWVTVSLFPAALVILHFFLCPVEKRYNLQIESLGALLLLWLNMLQVQEVLLSKNVTTPHSFII